MAEFPADLVLRTERLVLRPITPNDTDAIWPYVSDPDLSRFMSWRPHRNLEETRSFLERLQADQLEGKSITWAIVSGEQVCGIISLIAILRIHRALTYNKAELAYWLGEPHRGKGLMSEAGRHVIDFAFGPLGFHRLTVGHAVENGASEALIKRWGFEYIGEERKAFMKDDQWIDHRLYQLLHEDYRPAS